MLIDSNVDHLEGPVHQLQQEAKKDRTIFCDHVHYKDMADIAEKYLLEGATLGKILTGLER